MSTELEPREPDQCLERARRVATWGGILTGFYISFTTVLLLVKNASEVAGLLIPLIPGGVFIAWFSGYAYKELNPRFKGRLWEASMEFMGGAKLDLGPARKIGIGRMTASMLVGLLAAIFLALIIFG